MMAKLGGLDDLPSNAQSFLINYRTRLETMSETHSPRRSRGRLRVLQRDGRRRRSAETKGSDAKDRGQSCAVPETA